MVASQVMIQLPLACNEIRPATMPCGCFVPIYSKCKHKHICMPAERSTTAWLHCRHVQHHAETPFLVVAESQMTVCTPHWLLHNVFSSMRCVCREPRYCFLAQRLLCGEFQQVPEQCGSSFISRAFSQASIGSLRLPPDPG